MNIDSLQDLNGYQFQQCLHETPQVVIYRGIRLHDHLRVVLKLLKIQTAAEDFHREYRFLESLQGKGAIKTYGLESFGNELTLILEDVDGMNLDRFLQKSALGLLQKLQLCIWIAETLHEIHQRGVLHKRLNPSHMMLNPCKAEIKLLGFKEAHSLVAQHPVSPFPHWLGGEPSYLAPEQTGWIPGPLDQRTDLFAVGVIFYQIFGKELPYPPFGKTDFLGPGWACIPPYLPTLNPQVPDIIDVLIRTLIAPNIEDRYSSVAGLLHDLNRCRILLVKDNSIESISRQSIS